MLFISTLLYRSETSSQIRLFTSRQTKKHINNILRINAITTILDGYINNYVWSSDLNGHKEKID
jgi:hypothetical protein